MKILETEGWEDYELIDSGEGRRLERFGKYTLDRPDPQIIWKKNLSEDEWNKSDAIFERLENDRGEWTQKTSIPEEWLLHFKNLSFWARLTPFKHTGIFPEQSINWDFISKKITEAGRPINVLNLFGYTGIASLAAAEAGAIVTHVDASRPAMTWFRENQEASKLMDKPIRLILDDVLVFTEREARRGVKYDAIIMDPPAYGHDPKGKIWEFNRDFPKLLSNCKNILSDNPLFVLVNTYAISSSAITLKNVMQDYLKDFGGKIEEGELALKEKSTGRLLSTGIWSKWEKQ
jgi:23S rRNA (cytosine1962-C5)-methyltransferase